jgi:hypothetical protein
MSLYTVIGWCKVTLCLFDIHRVQYGNGLNTAMTYFTMIHSSWVVKRGQQSLDFLLWSHSQVNSINQLGRSSTSSVEFQDFQNMMKYILSQLSLVNLVPWLAPCWFYHCLLFEVFDYSHCLCFHSLQIADCAQGLPKTWCSLIHPDCSWEHLKPAVWCVPWMEYGSAKQATRLHRPQVLITAHVSWSNLRKNYQS